MSDKTFSVRKVENAGGTPGHTLFFTRMSPRHVYQLYENEAMELHRNLGIALGIESGDDAEGGDA